MGWRKAISEDRDKAQSRVLVWVVGAFLVGMSAYVFRVAGRLGDRFPVFALESFAFSVAFALVVRRLRAATVGGAVFGGMICFLVTFWTGVWTKSLVRSGLVPLMVLFLLTFVATRAGRRRKMAEGLAEKKHGRSAAQVIANLSVAGICASPWMGWVFGGETSPMVTGGTIWILETMCLAALVEATADTVSSEIGQAFGGQPVMITTMRRVETGTDGAVTVLGSFAGLMGGVGVAAVGGWAMHLSARAAMVGLAAGICGLFFDSLVGATLEQRGWMGNDLVNFASTAFAAGVARVGCWWMMR